MFNKKFWLIIIIVFAILNLSLVIFFEPLKNFGQKIFHRSVDWYAVHLTNGQVYFGQIKKITPETIKLSSVYFLETYEAQPVADGQVGDFQVQPQRTFNLVKRGTDNLFLTDHILFINRSAVLFWEKLKTESEIVKWIEKNKNL